MRKLKLLMATLAMIVGGVNCAWAQASYNHTYTEGVEVAAGENYFLYNIKSGMFLTDGMDYGTHASVDHAGRVITLAANTNGYSIYTKPYSANGPAEKAGYLTLNGYVDTGTNNADWVFTPVTVAGYTNAYTIKHSDTQYLYYEVKDGLYQSKMGAFANVGNSTGDEASYWLLIPMSARQAVHDYTYLLRNTDFHHPWELMMWSNTAGWTNQAGGLKENACAEMYGKGFDISQTISATVPNGKYKLYNQAFYNNADNANLTYLYANNDQKDISILNANGEGTAANMAGASTAFTAGQYVNEVSTVVKDGSLKVGLKNATTAGNAWTIMDNFYLEYLGTCLVNDAVVLPENGEMAADTWYYFDIAAAADNYMATATALSDIICISDGNVLTAEATVGDVTLAAENNSFVAGRYYVKSSTANNLEIGVASYLYVVGEATVDKSYIQGGNIVTVTYADLASNDPSATLTKNFSGVTFGGATIDVTATENGFTFEVPSTVTAATDYVLSIPANALGYAAGSEFNAAQQITLKTPAVLDGVYYMYNTYTKNYLSRGGSYATQAIMDNYGLAVVISTDVDNNTKVQYFDYDRFLGDDGFCYADCNGGRIRSYKVTKVADGYKFLNTNNSKYLAVYEGQAVGDAVEGGNLVGTSNVWSLESTADHVENYTLNANAQVAEATSNIAALSSVTTKAALESELASNYFEISVAITGAKAEKYQSYATNANPSVEAAYYTETVTDLKPGLYKLSVDAFQRAGSNARVSAADGARSLVYIYAGTAKTQVKSVMDASSATAYSSDYAVGDKHYPNNESSAYTALGNCDYSNDVYVYVKADDGAETGTLEIGIKNPTYPGGKNEMWTVYNNWTLTYYETLGNAKAAFAEAIDAAEAKTLGFEESEYAPYNNVDALQTLATAKAINVDEATNENVAAATTALTKATWTANTEEVNAIYDGTFKIQGENTVSPVTAAGWKANDADDIRQRIANTESYPGLLDATDKVGLYVWGDNVKTYKYGETSGYTMPLKENTIYEFSMKFAGWNGALEAISVSILNESTGMPVTNLGKASQGINSASSLVTYNTKFVTGSAGNYVLAVVPKGNAVLTDISITKAASQVLEFADGAVPTYAPGTYPAVKISRTLTADKWATAVYPFAVSGVSEIAVLDSYNKETGALGFKSATASEANKPFLMRSSAGTTEVNLSDVEVVAAEATNAVASEAKLIGTYSELTIDNSAKNYVLVSNQIRPVGSNVKVAPYRAYIQVDQPGEARALSFFIDGETTTAIEGISVENERGDIYNLNGQRVNKAQKGLYIQNGKKVVLK